MLLLDPSIPVLTNYGYIPAERLDLSKKLISGEFKHLSIRSVEKVKLTTKYYLLRWDYGAKAFRFPADVSIYVDDGICEYYPVEELGDTKLKLVVGIPPELFEVVPFTGIEEVFIKLIKINKCALKSIGKKDIGLGISRELLYSQTRQPVGDSYFLLGLLRLDYEARLRLVNLILKNSSSFGVCRAIQLRNLYDAYNLREVYGRIGIFPALAIRKQNNICRIQLNESEAKEPAIHKFEVLLTIYKPCKDEQEWILVNPAENKPIIAAHLLLKNNI